jgi:acyl carrier protein
MDQKFMDMLAPLLPLLGDRPLTADTRLRDAGLDSMQAVEALVAIEEAFHVSLPDEELNERTFATPASLWQAVRLAMGTDPAS